MFCEQVPIEDRRRR